MTLKTVFMFAGQGSQYHQMGRWLYEHKEVFRRTLQDLDAMVKKERGDSVLEEIYGPDRRLEDAFDRFRYSQPAIFMVEYSLAQMLMAEGIRPDAVLGVSLGEVAAAAVAGVVQPHECLSLLLRQVDIFEALCPSGGMLAVLADPQLFQRSAALHDHTQLAAVNSRSNFVVAGREEDLDGVEKHLSGERILFQRLPVPFAFHSSHIEPVEDEFKGLVAQLRFRRPQIPFLSCTTGGEVGTLDVDHFWQVLRRPFDFDRMLDEQLREDRYLYLDLGPSGSLGNVVKSRLREDSASQSLPLLSPFSQDGALLEQVQTFRAERTTPPTTEVRKLNMRKLRVYVFPGQGSQVKGMGEELFDRFPDLTAQTDNILGYSIRTLCVEDPDGRLRQTEYTQPALYVVNALTYLMTLQEGTRLPDYVLGHSLGEYNALFAGGVFDYETGLRLVQKRGELMSRSSGGTMAAVVGCDVEALRGVLRRHGLDAIDVANINAPSQIVISGPKDTVRQALPAFEEVEARCVPLNVSAPFHSRYMSGAAEEFGRFVDRFEFSAPKVPIVANVDAKPYGTDDIKQKLRQQIDSPVQWTDSIRYLRGKGMLEVRELGPGKVLTALVSQIQSEATALPTDAAGLARSEVEAVRHGEQQPEIRRSVSPSVSAETLGAAEFREEYGVRYAYAAGGMYEGISSVELVARMAGAGLLSFLGTSGLRATRIADDIQRLRRQLQSGGSFGVNLTYDPFALEAERETVDTVLRNDVRYLEASAYVQITPELVRYRLRGCHLLTDGRTHAPQKLLAKVTRPDLARLFLEPPPPGIVTRLLEEGAITPDEAEAARFLPMADDVCAVGDAGGYTEMGVLPALLPSVVRLRDEVARAQPSLKPVRVGAGGGIGTPQAAAAAFVLGADFVLTGSANLCTVESAISARVKDMLQVLDVHDTTYAPFGDLFELGGRARVMKKGTLFHARANKLYDLWRNHDDWHHIDSAVRRQVEERYFRATFDDVYEDLRRGAALNGTEPEPKRKMALVFRWYCDRALHFALDGEADREVDFQVCCGPALGACNQWLRGTDLEPWRNRHVEELGRRMMAEAAEVFNRKTKQPRLALATA